MRGHAFSVSPYDTEARDSVAIGLELRIPISNLSDQARAVSARVSLQQQELSLKDLEQRLEAQVRNSLRTVAISWQQLQLAQLAVKLSEQKLDIERERLRAGRSSNFQVVTFEDDLVRTRTDLLAAQIGYLNAYARAGSNRRRSSHVLSVSLAVSPTPRRRPAAEGSQMQ